MQCEHCNGEFDPYRKAQKYCSRKCYCADWRKKNPGKYPAYNRKSRLKKKLYCRSCGEVIPNEMRRSGLVFCSDQCRLDQKIKLERARSRERHREFRDFKCDKGCTICGYNKFGGSLDFHHIEPGEKEKRIDPMNWKRQKLEIDKCVLLCKNCHYEMHDKMRYDLEGYWETICLRKEKDE